MTAHLQVLLTEIKGLVSCPDKIYKQLYLTTLTQFIIHCPAELINNRLRDTIKTLKLRRGILLPKNAGAETIAAEEAQWTYALFTGSLLLEISPSTIQKILPDIANIWLSKNSKLFEQWQTVLFKVPDINNDLYEVIQHARSLNYQ